MSLWRCPQCVALYNNVYVCPTCGVTTDFLEHPSVPVLVAEKEQLRDIANGNATAAVLLAEQLKAAEQRADTLHAELRHVTHSSRENEWQEKYAALASEVETLKQEKANLETLCGIEIFTLRQRFDAQEAEIARLREAQNTKGDDAVTRRDNRDSATDDPPHPSTGDR